MSEIFTLVLDNGLIVLIEPMPGVESAAINWRLPVGAAGDPEDCIGESAVLSEFVFRGAGGLSSRQHSEAMDRLGVERASSVGTNHLVLSAIMLGSRLVEAMPLFAAIVNDLAMESKDLEPTKNLCLQAIESLKDEPQHLAMVRLREKHMPPPFNRHGYGEVEHIRRLTIDRARRAWRARCLPGGAILGFAGSIDPEEVQSNLAELLADWTGRSDEPRELAPPACGVSHIEGPTAQVHIGIAYDAPPEPDEHAMLERLAVAVMSGGMSGRLFTEVREKRSLCYAVNASYSPGRDYGAVSLYAGTTPDRARETLDVCLGEIRRMRDGVTRDEFDNAVVGLKSRLVMQGESTSARASALTRDQFRIGRPRTLEEFADAIDRITLDQLNEYLSGRDFGEFTVVSVGPVELELR